MHVSVQVCTSVWCVSEGKKEKLLASKLASDCSIFSMERGV